MHEVAHRAGDLQQPGGPEATRDLLEELVMLGILRRVGLARYAPRGRGPVLSLLRCTP